MGGVMKNLVRRSYILSFISYRNELLKAMLRKKRVNRKARRSQKKKKELSQEVQTIADHHLTAMNNQCNQAGCRFLVVYIPYKPSQSAQEFDHERQVLTRITKERGIRFFDLQPIVNAATHEPESEALYFANDGHWNQAGHRLAGESIANYFQSLK